MKDDIYYDIALSLVPNVGSVSFKQLITYAKTAKAVFELSKPELMQVPNVGLKTAEHILQKNTFQRAENELLNAQKHQIKILSINSEEYPIRLKNIYNPPSILYLKGQIPDNQKVIAIVGSRKATEYGKNITDKFMEALLPHNPLIVSGLAYGIDIQAHRKALQLDLPTVGVMATGIDIIYPSEHQQTALRMVQEGGGLLTENLFGTKPDSLRFPDRNRIIAGLSDVIIVVEAAIKGGALITAEYANEYSREVFAVPNAIGSKLSEGCNMLISRHKAHLLNSVEDLLYIMNWNSNKKTTTKKEYSPQLSSDEQKIVDLLVKNANLHIDQIVWHTQLNQGQVSATLLELEFKGLIKALQGKRYTLN